MKRVAAAVVCAAAVLPGGVAVQVASTATLQARAVAWLSSHRDAPQQDELAELKSQNPEAYAIVKALLTKRSLGLLDPHHPSASFAAPPPQQSDDAPQGAAAFEAIAAESGEPLKAAPVYAEAPVSSHHDWMNWKPQQSAMDDEAMVKNVLGAAASLKSGGAPALRGGSSGGGDDPADSLRWEEPEPAALPAAPAAPAAPVLPQAPKGGAKPPASMSQENSYLKGLGFGDMTAPPPPAASQANSYLEGLDLGGPDAAPEAAAAAPAAPAAPKPVIGLSAVGRQGGADYLSGFSWGDAAAAPQAHAAAPAAPAPTVEAAGAPPASASGGPKSSALMSWLTGVKPAAKKAPVPAQAPAQNSYLMDLN